MNASNIILQNLRKLSFPRKRESRRLPSMAAGFRHPSRNDSRKAVVRGVCVSPVLLLFVLPVAAAADECFCLVNKDDHFRHSCEMQQQGPRQVAQCQDDAGKPYKVDDMSGWTRIDAGQGRCNPCKKQESNITRGGDIRGKDSQQPVKNTADDHAK